MGLNYAWFGEGNPSALLEEHVEDIGACLNVDGLL